MKRFASIIGAGLLALALAACSTNNTSTTPTPVTPTGNAVSDTILQVQQQAKDICGFLPALSTVTGLVGGLTGQSNAATQINQIATTICQVVAPKPGTVRPGAGPSIRDRANGVYGTVDGVQIKGQFVTR